MASIRLVLFILALLPLSELCIAQQVPDAAKVVKSPPPVPPKMPPVTPKSGQSPGYAGAATQDSLDKQAALLKSQTDAILALGKKIEELTVRVDALEQSGKTKKP